MKSLLEASGIECILQDKNIASSYPAVTFYTGIKVVVRKEDYEEAKSILQDYLE